MVKTFKSLLIGASVCLGMGAIVNTPAMAGTLSLQDATVTNTGSAGYLTYGSDATNTFVVSNSGASGNWTNERAALGGNTGTPTGNVELFSNSETLTNSQFGSFTGVSSVAGQLGGKAITLSSLTMSDWNATLTGGKSLGRTWFEAALGANGMGSLNATQVTTLYNAFVAGGGLQRFSDPNIAYVTQDDTTGQIKIGLAGHLNARSIIATAIGASPLQPFQKVALVGMLPQTIQASEVVKYTYEGQTGYLYNFTATNSGLVEKSDEVSHTGIYEVTFQGVVPEKPPASTPEPSILLGLAGLGSCLAAKRKLKAA